MRPGRRRPAQAEGQRRVAWFNEGGCWPTKHPIWWECNWFLNILDPIYRRGHGASNCWKNKLLPASILPWREKKKTGDSLAVMRQFFLKSEDKPKEKEVEEWICGCHKYQLCIFDNSRHSWYLSVIRQCPGLGFHRCSSRTTQKVWFEHDSNQTFCGTVYSCCCCYSTCFITLIGSCAAPHQWGENAQLPENYNGRFGLNFESNFPLYSFLLLLLLLASHLLLFLFHQVCTFIASGMLVNLCLDDLGLTNTNDRGHYKQWLYRIWCHPVLAARICQNLVGLVKKYITVGVSFQNDKRYCYRIGSSWNFHTP